MRQNLLMSSTVMLLCSNVAFAQDSSAPNTSSGRTLEEVVVTAERRTSNMQTTAVAAAVLSGEDLEKKGVVSVDDLQFAMPSVTVQNSGQGNSFNIRGIGKTETNSATTVGVITYRDGIATFPAYFQTEPYYDISSLEVLRGPQGTFAGQNATGGAVFINERNPDFEGIGGYGQVQVGNYNDVRLQGALNIPISDTLAARVAFNTENRDSFYDITGPYKGSPGELNAKSGRVSLLWTPDDALRVLFKTDYNSIDQGGYPADPVLATNDPFEITANAPFAAKDTFLRSVLDVSYEFSSGIVLRSLSGYQDGTTQVGTDSDGTDILRNTFRDKVDERIYSQEVTLISPETDTFSWIIGAYYQDDLITFPPGEFVSGEPEGVFEILLEGETLKKTAAAFGQITYDLTDQLEVQVGARYSDTSSENDGVSSIPVLGISLAQKDKVSDRKVTGKVALNWTPDDRNFFYTFVATGQKAGGINSVNIQAIPPRAFDSEEVTDIEAGWKADWFEGRLRTQLGAYYNQYKNFQVTISDPDVPTINSILNVPDETTLMGIEGSAQARFGALAFDLGVSVSESELGDFYAADPRLPSSGPCDRDTGPANATCQDLSGNSQTYAPEFTFSAGIEYTFDLGQGATLTPRIDYSHIDATWVTLFQNEALGDQLDARDIFKAQLAYEIGTWSVVAYGTNLSDLEYNAAVKSNLRYAGPPRQYGVRLEKTF